jgi:hypothetical protein
LAHEATFALHGLEGAASTLDGGRPELKRAKDYLAQR